MKSKLTSMFLVLCAAAALQACGGRQTAARDVAALEADEAHLCAGISDDDHRSTAVFRKDLVSHVTPLYREERHGRATIQRLQGAVVHVRAAPHMTAPYLQRYLECQMVRRELGHTATRDASLDALWQQGNGPATIQVSETMHGFVVAIEGRDAEHAREVYSRAQALLHSDASSYAGNRSDVP